MIQFSAWARASGDEAGAQDAEITPPILDVPSTRGSRAHLPSANDGRRTLGVAILVSRVRSPQEGLFRATEIVLVTLSRAT